jgi:hypothetical protein
MICSSVNLLFLMSAILLKSGPRLLLLGTAWGEQVRQIKGLAVSPSPLFFRYGKKYESCSVYGHNVRCDQIVQRRSLLAAIWRRLV